LIERIVVLPVISCDEKKGVNVLKRYCRRSQI
jgi:hypothetical protein